jgi:hypothetical protein
MRNPFRYFNSSPEVICLTVMIYIRYPLSLRRVEDLLFERGIDICREKVQFWWNRFGPRFAAAIRKRRVRHRSYSSWRWLLDEVFVKINGETPSLARRGSRRRGARGVCYKAAGSQGCAEVSETGDQALWPASHYRDGPALIVRCRDEGDWNPEASGMWAFTQ